MALDFYQSGGRILFEHAYVSRCHCMLDYAQYFVSVDIAQIWLVKVKLESVVIPRSLASLTFEINVLFKA